MKFRLHSMLVPVATIAILMSGHAAQAQYIGDAYSLNLNLLGTGLGVTVADTGFLNTSTGGTLTNNLASATVGASNTLGANTGVVTNSTIGVSNHVTSFAEVDNLVANPIPILFGNLQLSASVVRSDVSATSTGQTGSSTIAGLVFGGMSITATGAVNQTVVDALGNTLVINEQIHNANGSLTVNALDLTLVLGLGKLKVASSTAGVPVAATPEPGSMALLTGCLVSGGCFVVRRRKKAKKQL